MNLRELMVDTKTVWVNFDGIPEFEVELSYISRSEMSKMIESSQRSKMSRSSRQIEKELDTDKFLEKFVSKAIKNWKGLTVERLAEFIPVDLNDENKDKEVEFNKESALFLLKESQMFDDWVNEKITDIDTFRNE